MIPDDVREALEHYWAALLTTPAQHFPVVRERIDSLLDRANRINSGRLSHNDAMRRDYLCEGDE